MKTYNKNSKNNSNLIEQQQQKQQQQERLESLFKKVFNNTVLNKIIFNYSRLYKKNEIIRFYKRNDLLEYNEIEYIHRLEYYSKKDGIEIGDLPINGALKELIFTRGYNFDVNFNSIPYGVELIDLGLKSRTKIKGKLTKKSTPMSDLPSTIHTLKNADIIIKNTTEAANMLSLPLNITSISFREYPCLSKLKIPNSIKGLSFSRNWDNEGIKLIKGDIPSNITSLDLGGYNINNISSNDILPISIKELKFSFKVKNTTEGMFNNVLSPKIETLTINCGGNILSNSNLPDDDDDDYDVPLNIQPNSLPKSITELELIDVNFVIRKNVIPNSVIKLSLFCDSFDDDDKISECVIPNSVVSLSTDKVAYMVNIIPKSLIHLNITSSSYQEIIETIPLLPFSIKSINIPRSFKPMNDTVLSSICKLKYGHNSSGRGKTSKPSNKTFTFKRNYEYIKEDIPSNITSLDLSNYEIRNLPSPSDMLSTIKHLTVTIKNNNDKDSDEDNEDSDEDNEDSDHDNKYSNQDNEDNEYTKGFFNFLVSSNVESLYIRCEGVLTSDSNLHLCKSIKKLTIKSANIFGECYDEIHLDTKIESGSLPPNITDLELIGIENVIDPGVIPSSVTNLVLKINGYSFTSLISEDSIPDSVSSLSINRALEDGDKFIFPKSITHIDINSDDSYENVIKTISLLPPSITSINIPKSLKSYNDIIQSSINKIKYI